MGYQFIMPKQIFYGENSLKSGASAICSLGKKALIVTDPSMVRLGNSKIVTDILDENGVIIASVKDSMTYSQLKEIIDNQLSK